MLIKALYIILKSDFLIHFSVYLKTSDIKYIIKLEKLVG